jgi:hypothetical protein
MSCKRTTLAAVLAALPFSLLAAEPTLTPVVVTASKEQAPPLATTVDAAGVQALRAATSDTASLLRDVPGVSLYGAGGVSSLPSIHGLADDRLRIKVDGMDLIASCPNHMNPALSYLDPSNVGSLRVYAGITPVSVGGDSIGGTIVADTPAPTFAGARPGQPVQGRGRRLLPQQRQCEGRQPFGHLRHRILQHDLFGRHQPSPTTTTPAATSRTANTPLPAAAGHTLPRSTKSARPRMKPATTRSVSRSRAATTWSRPSSATRTCPTSSTRTSAWTCSTTSRSA